MKNYKTVLIWSVVYSVVIGLIYATISMLAVLARHCVVDMKGSKLTYMMFLLFFRESKCKATIDWAIFGIDGTTPALPDEAEAVRRTYIFAIVYLALYVALVAFALLSLLGINNSCLGRKSFVISFVPWILICCAILVMDVVATVHYISDTIKATTINGFMELLEIQNPDAMRSTFEELSVYLRFTPPILMFLATSKCFIFMIMDIVIITLVARAGWAAATYHKYVNDTIRQYSANIASRSNPAFEDSQSDILAQKQHNKQVEYLHYKGVQDGPIRPAVAEQLETPNRYNDTSRDTNPVAFVYPERTNNMRNDERLSEAKQHSIPRPNTLPLQSKLNERPLSQQSVNPQQYTLNPPQRFDNRDIDNRMSHFATSNGKDVRSVEPLKDEIVSERQQQQIRVKVLPTGVNRNSSEIKQRPPVPPKPQKLTTQPSIVEERRHENPDGRSSAAKIDRNSSMHGPEELRGQHPWSYFKARDDVPKKAFTELKEDEELPPVPIPDYTLHFPKAKRTNLNSDSDGEGSWSRYEQRY